ncbi:MAG TPA: hypothetical protein VF385_01975 [Patescibacteria group bacterium]
MKEVYIGIIGVVAGAILTGVAMILNSYFSNKFLEKRDDKIKKKNRLEKDFDEIQKFYEQVLHLSDKLIRKEGRAVENELEEFYRFKIKLKLISNSEILAKFEELSGDIGDFARKLPQLYDEFIPTFENDDHKRFRLEAEKEAKSEREKEAKKYRPKLYKKHSELSKLMKDHLQDIKDLI